MVGAQRVRPRRHGQGRKEALPGFRKELRGAEAIEPVDLARARAEHAAQHERLDTRAMQLRIAQRQRCAPRAPQHDPPARHAEVDAQGLDVIDQVLRRVGGKPVGRARTPAATLVEQHDVIARRVEQPSVICIAAAARPAMQEKRGPPRRVPAAFPVDLMAAADLKEAGPRRLDEWIEHGAG